MIYPSKIKIWLKKARRASELAYAPYSHFNVGAAGLLNDGKIVMASNKENASFPAGICAERNLVNYVSDHHKDKSIISIAILASSNAVNLDNTIAPCGICRQVFMRN